MQFYKTAAAILFKITILKMKGKKIMKKFTWLGFLLVLCTGNVFSQTIPGSVRLDPSEISNISKEIAPPDTTYEYGGYAVLYSDVLYLVAVMDWYSRYVLSWRIANSLDSTFCVDALDETLMSGCPEILNTDQGS